jgi:hypothetical protein
MAKPMDRDLAKEAHWRKHVEAQRASGLSMRVYCQGEGLSESCFYWWKREIARRDCEAPVQNGQQERAGVEFAEVRVIDGSGEEAFPRALEKPKPDLTDGTSVEIFLSDGRRLRVFPDFDEQTLLRVVALLEGARPC